MIKNFEGFDFFLSQIKPNLKDLTRFAFAYLLEQYQQIITQADSHLIKAARVQQGESDKARFIAAIEQCQHMKGGMIAAFGHGLMEALKPLNGHPAEAQPQLAFQGSVNSLASHARDDDTFMLGATTRACKQYENLTNEITEALIKTLPGSRINYLNNPFNPMIIGNAIFNSLKITSMHSTAKKEILVLFESLLLKNMDEFYRQVLQHLREAGVKVNIPNQALTLDDNDDDIPLLQPATAKLDTIDSDFNALIEDGVIAPDYNTHHYTPLEHQFAEDPKKKVIIIPVNDIDQLLANLQKGYDPGSDGNLPDYIKSHLMIESKTGEVKVIRRHDENIINLISLVFDQIAEGQDSRIADLFYRLKVPYTRLVLGDELFFHDQSHPARELLDNLLALSYSTHDDEMLLKQMQSCVMRILLKYNGENSLFRDLLILVKGYRENNSGPFAESLEAIRLQLENEEQKRFAFTTVSELIAQRSRRLSRRLRFHILIEKLMAQVLVDILLGKGNESKAWQIGTKLLDIVLILTDKNDSPHFKTLSNDLDNVIRKLGQFLAENGIESQRRQIFLSQLQEIHHLLGSGKKLSDLDDDELSFTYDVDMIIDDFDSEMVADIDTARIGSEHRNSSNARQMELIPEHKRPARNSAIQFVKNLQLGQWMNFIIDNHRIPCAPSYYSKQKDGYVFCDRHNKKLFERSRNEIIEDILSGFACPLESTLSFEGNLARVIAKLNNPD